MLIQDIMRPTVVTVSPGTTLPELLERMRSRGIHHLPVLDGDRLVGMLSDRDLKSSMASLSATRTLPDCERLIADLTAQDLMTRTVVTVGPLVAAEDAASLFVQHHIHALPVVQDGQVVGIVTDADLLSVLAAALGAGVAAGRLEVALGPTAHLGNVIAVVEEAGASVVSAATFAGRAGMRSVILRVVSADPERAISALESRGHWVRRTPLDTTA
jgi:acetoin utilization protein AcuB